MRECQRTYAHGPMKLKREMVDIEYRGEVVRCEKTVYACTQCDFELEQQWMKEKLQVAMEKAYEEKKLR